MVSDKCECNKQGKRTKIPKTSRHVQLKNINKKKLKVGDQGDLNPCFVYISNSVTPLNKIPGGGCLLKKLRVAMKNVFTSLWCHSLSSSLCLCWLNSLVCGFVDTRTRHTSWHAKTTKKKCGCNWFFIQERWHLHLQKKLNKYLVILFRIWQRKQPKQRPNRQRRSCQQQSSWLRIQQQCIQQLGKLQEKRKSQ